jgi:NADPH2:quinone reductase
MLLKRLTHIGSLRSRTYGDKSDLIAELKRNVWPHFESGAIKPEIY